jgi:hypothetical protein
MVEKYVSVREKLDKKVFTPYGQTVTFKSRSSPIYNSRGEEESVTETESQVSIVPYGVVAKRLSYQAFGDLAEGEMDAAVRYDVVVNEKDIFTIDGVDYKVVLVSENPLKENVVTIVRLAKVE